MFLAVLRPFRPSPGQGPYRLPLSRRRSDACCLPRSVLVCTGAGGGSFPIDRRELADQPDLGLTAKRVRSAITILEAVGFLELALTPSGSRYKATEHELHRKPILYVFGSEYGSAFVLANKRAQAACGAFLEPAHTEPLCP